MGDSDGYFTLGRAIAEGRPYEYGPQQAQIFRTPGYPAILAPVFRLAGGHAVLAARLENALLGTLAVAGVWWLSRQLFGPRAALLAAALAAFYPESIAASAMVLSDTPFFALMLLQLGLWTAAWKVGAERSPLFPCVLLALAAGLVAGAATLVRPSWLLFTPLAAMAGVLLHGRPAADGGNPRWRHLVIGVAMVAPMLLVMTPGAASQQADRPFRAHDAAGRRQPLRRLEPGSHRGQRHEARGGVERLFRDATRPRKMKRRRSMNIASTPACGKRLWAGLAPSRRRRCGWPGSSFCGSGTSGRTKRVFPRGPSGWRSPSRTCRCCCWVWRAACERFAAAGRTGYVGFRRCTSRALHAVFVGSIRYRQPAMLALIVLAAGVIVSWCPDGRAQGGRGKVEEG